MIVEKIRKVGEGAYFVPAYSTQTVAPTFQPAGTYQISSNTNDHEEEVPEEGNELRRG